MAEPLILTVGDALTASGTLELGQELWVRLEELPSSGFRWEIYNCPAWLELLAEQAGASAGDWEEAVGRARVHEFHFRVARLGPDASKELDTLWFVNHRSWERGTTDYQPRYAMLMLGCKPAGSAA